MPSQPAGTPAETGRSRRKRREQDRAAAKRPAPPPSRRSQPIVLISVAAIVVGLVFVAFLALQNAPTPVAATIRTPTSSTPTSLAHDRSLGDPNAPVTIDVWSDFQCPYCNQFWQTVEPSLVSAFIKTGQARLVNHDFVFLGPESTTAAIAARCADQQGKFWPFHDLLFANQGRENSGAFSTARLAQMATAAGLNVTDWTKCQVDPTIAQAVQQETAAGQALGVNGTPTIFVNGVKAASFDFNTIAAAVKAANPAAPTSGAGSSSAVPTSSAAGSAPAPTAPAVSATP